MKVNWCKLVNRADGISEIEGKAASGEQGRERVSNSCLWPFARKGDACGFRDNLNRPMENAGVEGRSPLVLPMKLCQESAHK